MSAMDDYKKKKKEMNALLADVIRKKANEAVSREMSGMDERVSELYQTHQAAENTWTDAAGFDVLKEKRADMIARTENVAKWLPYTSYSDKDKENIGAWIKNIQNSVDSGYVQAKEYLTAPRTERAKELLTDPRIGGPMARDTMSDNPNTSLADFAKQRQEYYSKYKDANDYATWSALEGGSLDDIQKFIDEAKAEGRADKIDTYKMQGDDYTITRPGEGEYLRQADIDRAQKIFDSKKYTQSVDGKTLRQIYENAYANFENDHKEYTYLADNAGRLNRSAKEYKDADEWLNERKTELTQKLSTLQEERDSITLHDNVNGHVATYYSQENRSRGKQLENDISQIEQEIEALDADMGKIYENKKISEYKEQYDSLPENSKFLIDYFARIEDDPLLGYQTADAQKAAEIVGSFADTKSITEYLVKEGVIDGADDRERANMMRDLADSRGYLIDLEKAEQDAREQADFANEHPFLASVSSIPTSLVSGIAALPEVVRATVTGDDVNRYSAAFAPTRYTKTVRGTVSEGIESEFGKFAYDTVMSMADSAGAMGIGIATGGLTGAVGGASAKAVQTVASVTSNVIMSSSAGANAIYEGLEKGYSSEKAVALGVISGLIEAASEKFSIDTILNSAGKDTFWKTIGKSFIAEGSEEVVSNWGNKIADVLANKSQADIYQAILSYQDAGYSSGEALARAVADSLGDDALAFVAGGLSGAAMGSVAKIGSVVSDRINTKKYASDAVRFQISEDENAVKAKYGVEKLNDYIHVQRQVFGKLTKNGFFTDEGGRSRTEVNAESGMEVVIGKKGIYETFSKDNFSHNGKALKLAKLATVEHIPEVIKNGHITLDNVPNEHGAERTTRYAYIEGNTSIGGKPVTLRLAIRKSENKNKFWVHSLVESKNAGFTSRTENQSQHEHSKPTFIKSIIAQDGQKYNTEIKNNTKAPDEIVRPYIGRGNQKVVRGTEIKAINADGTFEMSTVDRKGEDAGNVTISADDLPSRVRGIYDAVILSTNDADIANAIIPVAASDPGVARVLSADTVNTAVAIAQSGLSLSSPAVSMFAGVNTESWERASDALKQAIYGAAQKTEGKNGVNYAGALSHSDILRAYAAEGKLGTKKAADTMLRLIDGIGKQYGVQVIFADLAPGYKGGHISGTNKIVLGTDIDAGLLTRTMGHEMFHYLKGLNGTLAGQLQSDVITWLKDTGKYDAVYAQFEENYDENISGMNETEKRAYLEEEMAADSCFDALSNDRFLADFYTRTAEKKNGKEFLQKLADFFREIAQMLRNAVENFTRGYSGNELVAALAADQKMLDHINERFGKLLEAAQTQQNKKSAANSQQEETIRFSRMNEKSFEENVDAILSMSDEQAKKNAQEGNFVRVLEHTPSVILDHVNDAADHEIIISFHSLYLSARNNGILPGHYHHLGEEIIHDLPQCLSDPDTIVRTDNDRILLLSTVNNYKGRNGIISVELNTVKDINSRYQKYNLVITVFSAKDNYTKNTITKHGVKVEYEKEGLAQVNPQLHEWLAIVNAKPSTDSISESGQNVNTLDNENSGNVRYQKSADSARAEQYTYDALISKPDMLITRISDRNIPEPSKLARKGIVSHAIENAAKIGTRREDGSVSVRVKDTGSDIILSRKGLEHGLDRRFSVNAPVTLKAGEILQNAIRINEMIPTNERANSSSILIGMTRNEKNEPYVVRFVVNEFSSEVEDVEVLYALNAKKEPGALLPPATEKSALDTDSAISISELLDFVNRYFPDILPESVLRHYGHTARPDGVLGESALFQKSADSAHLRAKQYTYDALISKPDMLVTRISDKKVYRSTKDDREGVVNNAIKNVRQIGGINEQGNAFVHVYDIDADVIVTRNSIKHGIDRRLNDLGSVSENIGSILQNSIRINELNPRTDNIDESYVLIGCAINQDGNPYIVRSVVNKYSYKLSSLDVLYAINTKKESAVLNAPRLALKPSTITDPAISISELLDFVNRYFPDILPESVLRHYGHTARPDGVLGKSALFQKSADSARDAELREMRMGSERVQQQNKLINDGFAIADRSEPLKKPLKRYLNDIMQRYGVQYDDAGKLQAFEKLCEIYTYLINDRRANPTRAQDMAYQLATDMIKHSKNLYRQTPYSAAEREFRREMRRIGLRLNDTQKTTVVNAYGSFANFRRQYGFTIRIDQENGLSVSDVIEQAQNIYGIETADENQFLLDLLPKMKSHAEFARGIYIDKYGTGDAQAASMAAIDLSVDLLDALLNPNIVPVKNITDDTVLLAEHNAELAKYRKNALRTHIDKARSQNDGDVKNNKEQEAEQLAIAIRQMAERYAQMTYKEREKRKISETQQKLDRLINQMNARLFRPKENKYVPQDMQCAIIGVLEAANRFDGDRAERLARYDKMINAASGEHRTELERIRKIVADGGQSIGDAIGAVKEMYKAYEPKEDGASPNTIQGAAYDPVVTKLLERAENELKGLNSSDLNSDQLDMLYRAIRATEKVVSNAVKLNDSRIKKNVYEAGRELIRETRAVKGKKDGIASGFLQLSLTPRVYFERLGGFAKDSAWVKIYEDLNDAQREMLNIKMQGTLIFDGVMTGKENAEALRAMVSEKNAVDIGLTDADGKAIKLTHDQLISLYLHMQSEDNLRHMESGGISIRTKGGKIRAVGVGQKLIEANGLKNDAQSRISAFNMQEATERWQRMSDEEKRRLYDERQDAEKQLAEAEREIERIRKEHAAGIEDLRGKVEKALTDYDRAWADAAKEFFHYSATLLDEVTYDRYGFHRDLIDSYYPIMTDSDFTKTEIESFGNEATLEGMGFLKDRVISYNPLVLVGVTDTVSRHLDGISKYAGMSGAIDNFKKLYNMIDSGYSDSVKNAINDVFGKKNGSDYLEKIISDMQGLSGEKTDFFHQLTAILRGGLAASSLTLNPRVALLQTASYPTAAAELGYKALARALARKDSDSLPVFSRADKELIAKYSPLLWYRLQGYTTEKFDGLSEKAKTIAKIKDNTVIKKGLLGWISAMDAATVGRLWYAAQYYVDDNFEYLKHGSEEWYKEVADAFNRTVERTQPNYTALQRTAIARSKNEFAKAFAMFTTQRLQNFNIAYSAAARLMRYQYDFGKGRGGVTKSDLRKARRALARSLSALIVAGVDIAVSRVLVQALLHNLKAYRDDDDELTAQSVAAATAAYFAESMSSNVLFGSEVYAIIDHWISGGVYYTPELSGLGTVTDLVEDIVNIGDNLKSAVAENTDDDDRWEKVRKKAMQFAESVCVVYGIPARNIGMIGKALGGHINSIKGILDGTIDGKWDKYFDDDLGVLSRAQKVKMADIRADSVDETAKKLRELYNGAADDKERSDIKSEIVKYYHEKWEKNSGGRDEYYDKMYRTGLWGEYELNTKFREWEYKKDTGEKSFSKSDDLYNAIRNSKDIEKAIEEYKTFISQTGDKAEKKVREEVKEQIGKNLTDGNIDEDTAVEYLMQYVGEKPGEAAKTVAGFYRAAEEERIEERFMNGSLDYDGAVDALRDAGYTRKKAEEIAGEWRNDKRHYFQG